MICKESSTRRQHIEQAYGNLEFSTSSVRVDTKVAIRLTAGAGAGSSELTPEVRQILKVGDSKGRIFPQDDCSVFPSSTIHGFYGRNLDQVGPYKVKCVSHIVNVPMREHQIISRHSLASDLIIPRDASRIKFGEKRI